MYADIEISNVFNLNKHFSFLSFHFHTWLNAIVTQNSNVDIVISIVLNLNTFLFFFLSFSFS